MKLADTTHTTHTTAGGSSDDGDSKTALWVILGIALGILGVSALAFVVYSISKQKPWIRSVTTSPPPHVQWRLLETHTRHTTRHTFAGGSRKWDPRHRVAIRCPRVTVRW